MTRHLKNIPIKIIYISSLVFFYFSIFWIFQIKIEPYIIFSWFFVLFTLYYIMDLFNFQVSGYRVQDGILSLTFHFFNSVIFYLFYRAEKFLVIFFIIAVLENLAKFFLIKRGVHREKILILGSSCKNEEIKKAIFKDKNYDYVGYLGDKQMGGEKSLGDYKNLPEVVIQNRVDKIVVLDTEMEKPFVRHLLSLKTKGVDIKDYFTFHEEMRWRIDVKSIDERWLAFSSGFNIYHTGYQKKLKRVFDIFMAIIVLILASPIMILTAIIIKAESPGPVFFIQNRVGYNGEVFNILKFRSMKKDAEKDGPKWAEKNDPRVTRFGKLMRRARIDELPQLLNILRGEMSFVGPRPERPIFIDKLEKEIPFYNLRHSVQPGLTGWAQVMYPYGASVDDALCKLEYDLYYIKYQNFIMDMLILLKTIRIVVFGKGR